MHATPGRLAYLVTMLVAMPLLAHAGPKEQAKAHVVKATKAHHDGKFDVALHELLAAYQLDPQPELLFAIAQVHVKLDNCSEAISFYEKFLAATDDPQARPIVTEAIAACKTKLEQAQPPPEPPANPPPPPEPVAAPSIPEPTPEPEPKPVIQPAPQPVERVPARVELTTSSAWYRDPIGDTLVIGGAIAGVVGVVLFAKARSDLDSAETAQTLAGYHDLVDSGHSERLYSVLLVGGGVALVGAGVAHLVLRDRGGAHGLGMVPASGGGLVTWSRGF